MAENLVVKMARSLAVTHIIVGLLMICSAFPKMNELGSAWIIPAACFGAWVSCEYGQKLDR